MDKLITIQLIYAAVCVILAYINAKIIFKDKPITHWYNGAVHIAVIGLAFLLTHEWLLILIMLLEGRLVFDLALNKFRGLPFNYVSEWVKAGDKRSSKIDVAEWKIFKSGALPKILYMAIIIILNVLM